MIYIGNNPELTAISIGESSVTYIDFGSTRVWPSGVVTYSVVDVSRVYSTGTYIKADGSNYAYITGTLITYVDGSETSRRSVVLDASFNGAYDTAIWSISDNYVYATNSGAMYRDYSRSVSVYGHSSVTGQDYGPFDVWQEANTYSPVGTGQMIFQLNGRGTLTEVDEHHSTLSLSYDSSIDPYGFNTWIVRDVVYTSGAPGTMTVSDTQQYSYILNPNTFATITDSAGTTYSNITSPRYISGVKLSTAKFADLSGTADRGMSITARDITYPTAIYREIAITQYADHAYRLDVYDTNNNYYLRYDSSNGIDTRNPMTISAVTSEFTLIAYSTQDSVKYPLTTSSITTTGSIGLTCTSVVNSPSTSALYRMTFTCDVNTATSSRTATIGILQGMTIHRITVSQAANTDAFDGITVKSSYVDGDNNTWVIGICKSGDTSIGGQSYEVNGVVVACDSQIETATTIQFTSLAVQRIINIGTQDAAGRTYSVPSGTTQVIPAGSTLTFNGVTYYGTWVVLPGVTWSNGWVQGTSNTTLTPYPGTSLNTAGFVVN